MATRLWHERTVGVRMLRKILDLGPTGESSTQAKISSLMSVVFNHAIRYESLKQGKNRIAFVRQRAEWLRPPEMLEPLRFSACYLGFNHHTRPMVLMAVTTGSAQRLFRTQWGDVDLTSGTLTSPELAGTTR